MDFMKALGKKITGTCLIVGWLAATIASSRRTLFTLLSHMHILCTIVGIVGGSDLPKQEEQLGAGMVDMFPYNFSSKWTCCLQGWQDSRSSNHFQVSRRRQYQAYCQLGHEVSCGYGYSSQGTHVTKRTSYLVYVVVVKVVELATAHMWHYECLFYFCCNHSHSLHSLVLSSLAWNIY